jgi:hypothetical protein
MGDDGKTKVDLVTYSIEARKLAQDCSDWKTNRGEC